MMSEKTLGDAAFAAASLDDAIRNGRYDENGERALFIAAEAGLGRLCDEAQSNEDERCHLTEALGDETIYQDMEEIRRLLTGVDYFKQLQTLAPSSSSAMSEQQRYQFRNLFLAAYEQSKTLGAYLVLALKGRFDKPWLALDVYYHLARGADDELRAAKDAVAALPESLLEEVENLVRAMERDGAEKLDAKAALLRVKFFADYAEGLAGPAKKVGDNVLLNRVEASREIAAEAFERFVEQALAQLRIAMPVRHAAGSSRLMSQRPDISEPLSAYIIDNAKDAVTLIAAAPGLSARLGAGADFTGSITDEARDKLHLFAKDLIVEIRASEGEERKAARRMLDHILKISEPLLNSDETGLLRDRAAAAAVAV